LDAAPVEALLVGLGNPGPGYSANRHNIGFRVIEALAARAGLRLTRERLFSAGVGRLAGRPVAVIQPLAMMNRSGRAVGAVLDALASNGIELPPEACLVVHDELDLPFATLRLKRGGGHGGHRGVRSIVERIGPDFPRLRVGIGHPGPGADVSAYVLSDFSEPEHAELGALVTAAADAAERVLLDGLDAAMNLVNTKNTDT